MGAGVALQAADRFPELPKKLGQRLRGSGNYVYHMGVFRLDQPDPASERALISFPTKTLWRRCSTENLIASSAYELSLLAEHADIRPTVVIITRVGTGLGGLSWTTVKPILERHLIGDRFVVVSQ